MILLLAARAAGCTPGELIARAIVHYARDAVGMPGLCDELSGLPEAFRRAGKSRFSPAPPGAD